MVGAAAGIGLAALIAAAPVTGGASLALAGAAAAVSDGIALGVTSTNFASKFGSGAFTGNEMFILKLDCVC